MLQAVFTRHEAKKILVAARKIQEAVDEVLGYLEPANRERAESGWAGKLRALTTCREDCPNNTMPVAEAEMLLDTGAAN